MKKFKEFSKEIDTLIESTQIEEKFGCCDASSTSFGKKLASSHGLDPDRINASHRRAIFDLTYNSNSPFKNEASARAFLNSPHGAELADSHSNVTKHPRFKELVTSFGKSSPSYFYESVELSEATAPGMEDWVKANKKNFIDQYGEEKGTKILYATAWKLHDKKMNESSQIDEMVIDRITHPKFGKVEWKNEGGYHTISTTSKETGAQVIHVLGDGKKVAGKWKELKDKLLQEDADWTVGGGTLQLQEEVAKEYSEDQ